MSVRLAGINSPGMRAIVAALKKYGPMDIYGIGPRADMAPLSVRDYARSLHAVGRIHISGWIYTQGPQAPIYAAGPGADAPKLPKRESSQATEEYEQLDCTAHRMRAARILATPDPITRALMGL